jgi:hypothetical protein
MAQDGALQGLVFGVPAVLVAVPVVLIQPRVLERLQMSVWALSAYYLIGAPALGALGGLLRSRLPGRWGRRLIAAIIGALTAVALLPVWRGSPLAWGFVEYFTILSSAALAPYIAGWSRD